MIEMLRQGRQRNSDLMMNFCLFIIDFQLIDLYGTIFMIDFGKVGMLITYGSD